MTEVDQLNEEETERHESYVNGNGSGINLRNSNTPSLTTKERIVDQRSLTDCAIHSVTVFLDKAEVCRIVPVQITNEQQLELIFNNISPAIDKDSIRVETRGAPLTIQDVTIRNLSTFSNLDCGVLDGELKRLHEQQRQNYRQKESLTARQKRLHKQRAVLERFADVLVRNNDCHSQINTEASANPEEAKPSFTEAFNPQHMETLNGFFEMYEKQAEKLDEQILNASDEMDMLDKQINSNDKNRMDLEDQRERIKGRELSVYVESKETINSHIMVGYIVNESRWRPSYDVRIINSESKMKITYYALIEQHTCEDWKDIQELYVSTVQPPLGGSVPDIGVQKVIFKSTNETKGFQSPSMKIKSRKNKAKSMLVSQASSNNQQVAQSLMESSIYTVNEELANNKDTLSQSTNKSPSAPLSSGNTLALRPSQDTPSAIYKVPRPPQLIQSNNPTQPNEPTKVIIGYLDLQPSFEYTCVPKKAPYAYLKSNAINSSDYAIIHGAANVFIDQNYVGKSSLDNVAPGESFTCYVGADQKIVINYHPMYKYREGAAPISKTTVLTFKQLMEITNQHPRTIKMTLIDQIPIANEDKIKVNLLEPSIKHSDKSDKSKPIRFTKHSQVEWDLEINSGEKKEITLKYTVEYPSGEMLDLLVE